MRDESKQTTSNETTSLMTSQSSNQSEEVDSSISLEAQQIADDLYNNFDEQMARDYLYKNDKFSELVGKCFLEKWDFKSMSLPDAMRSYFNRVELVGETGDREKCLKYFSDRFSDCNPDYIAVQGDLHIVVCAVILLNTDLHVTRAPSFLSNHKRMSCKDFIRNTRQGVSDVTRQVTDDNFFKEIYRAIKKKPITSPMTSSNQ